MLRKRSKSNANTLLFTNQEEYLNDSLTNKFKSISPSQRQSRNKLEDNLILEQEHLISCESQEKVKVGKIISNVIVVVRKRPLSYKEKEFNKSSIVKVLNDKVVVLYDPYEYNGPTDIFKNRNKEQYYTFDFSFDEFASQTDIYNTSVSHLIDSVLDGLNCTIFAYGATGAGKTYTMFGNVNNPGIIPLSLDNLFNEIENFGLSKNITVSMIYLEIYNENIRDLLKPHNDDQIEIREDSKGTIINGVSEVNVKTSLEVYNLLNKANKYRVTESTNANEVSSRSHAVLQLSLEVKDKSNTYIKRSKFSLIDLAGSERSTATQNRGIRLFEGANINKSLLTLGSCITALSDMAIKGTKSHVPFRDSKLTRILKDSLGGNSKTVMIANISPAVISYDDTYNTLKYANRAKNIKTKISKNILNTLNQPNYEGVIYSLNNEIAELKQKLSYSSPNKNKVMTYEDSFKDLLKEIKLTISEEMLINQKIINLKFEESRNKDSERFKQFDSAELNDELTDSYYYGKKIKKYEESLKYVSDNKNKLIQKLCLDNKNNFEIEYIQSLEEASQCKLKLYEVELMNKSTNEALGRKDFYIKQLEEQIKLRDEIFYSKQIDLSNNDQSKILNIRELKSNYKPKQNKASAIEKEVNQSPLPLIKEIENSQFSHINKFSRVKQPQKKVSTRSVLPILSSKEKTKSNTQLNKKFKLGNEYLNAMDKIRSVTQIVDLEKEVQNDSNNNYNFRLVHKQKGRSFHYNNPQLSNNYLNSRNNDIKYEETETNSYNNLNTNENIMTKGVIKKKDIVSHLYKRGQVKALKVNKDNYFY